MRAARIRKGSRHAAIDGIILLLEEQSQHREQ
jgi:hypothetical protein